MEGGAWLDQKLSFKPCSSLDKIRDMILYLSYPASREPSIHPSFLRHTDRQAVPAPLSPAPREHLVVPLLPWIGVDVGLLSGTALVSSRRNLGGARTLLK